MIGADAALFTGLGHYWEGMAQILRAELSGNESSALKKAAPTFKRAVTELTTVRKHEERILAVAQNIEFSAYFVRRHEVASHYTQALLQGVDAIARDLADGYYPAAACVVVNRVLARLMANFEQEALIEGVLTRFEFGAGAASSQSS